MADTVSDPGCSVLQSSVFCVTACEIKDDWHLYGAWGEIDAETDITTKGWNTLHDFRPDLYLGFQHLEFTDFA